MKKAFIFILLGLLLFAPRAYAQVFSESSAQNLENAVVRVAEDIGKAVVFISAEFSAPTSKQKLYFRSPLFLKMNSSSAFLRIFLASYPFQN